MGEGFEHVFFCQYAYFLGTVISKSFEPSPSRRNVMNILTGSALDEQQLDALLKDQLKGADELAVEEACKEINLHVVHKTA